jgi:hypothetical protein
LLVLSVGWGRSQPMNPDFLLFSKFLLSVQPLIGMRAISSTPHAPSCPQESREYRVFGGPTFRELSLSYGLPTNFDAGLAIALATGLAGSVIGLDIGLTHVDRLQKLSNR